MKRLVLLPAVTLLIAACVSAPEPVRPAVADESTFLGLAVAEASELADKLARAELYAQIATGYREMGDEQSMRSLALAALSLTRQNGATEDGIRIRLSLSPLLAAAGEDAAALSALESGLQYAATLQDSQQRASLLPRVVRYALQSDEPARPVVRRAIDEVYVIEDPRHRAEALINIGQAYQEGGASLSVSGLIQQAIPAVRSTPGAFRRAEMFSRLARLASATNEEQLAYRLIENTVTEIEEAGSPSDADDSERLLLLVDRLSRLERAEVAHELVGLFSDPYYTVRAIVALASHTLDREVRLNWLELAADAAGRIDDTQRYVDAHIRVGVGLARAESPERARAHAQVATDRLADEPTLYSRIESPSRLAELLVMLDRLDALREFLALAPDNYVRGAVAVRAADELIAEGRFGLADDFLMLALRASDEAAYLADGLRQQIVSGFAQTGSIRLAIRTIERMDDELLRARSVAELAVAAEPAGLVVPIYRADLASVLASR